MMSKYTYLNELKQFFYENQYDEDKYPHFRACDIVEEYDMEGNFYQYYNFYNY